MDYATYIIALEALKKLFENRIIGIIPLMEDFATQALMDWIDESLEIRQGSLIASEETIDILNDFDNNFLRVINSMKTYKGAVSSQLKDLPKISKVMQEYQEAVNGISWAAAHVEPVQKLVVNEIIKAYTDNGLNTNFVQPLRDLMYQNIVAGTSVKQAKQQLKEYVKGGNDKSGKLGQYLTITSQQAVDGYTGAINKKLMDVFDYPYLQMSGSLKDTSLPQCVHGIRKLEGLISREDFVTLEKIGKGNAWVPGTTFQNLTLNLLHYGCRHEFTPTMIKMGNPEVIKRIEETKLLK